MRIGDDHLRVTGTKVTSDSSNEAHYLTLHEAWRDLLIFSKRGHHGYQNAAWVPARFVVYRIKEVIADGEYIVEQVLRFDKKSIMDLVTGRDDYSLEEYRAKSCR